MCGGREYMNMRLCTFCSVCYEPKSSLKNKVYFKKIIQWKILFSSLTPDCSGLFSKGTNVSSFIRMFPRNLRYTQTISYIKSMDIISLFSSNGNVLNTLFYTLFFSPNDIPWRFFHIDTERTFFFIAL